MCLLLVNFLGSNDDLIVSGSDDGNFFIWDKHTAKLNGVYEGDGSIVNIIEGHPSLPLLAVSGLDTTVKVFCSMSSDPALAHIAMHSSLHLPRG